MQSCEIYGCIWEDIQNNQEYYIYNEVTFLARTLGSQYQECNETTHPGLRHQKA